MTASSRICVVGFTLIAATVLVAAVSATWVLAHGGPELAKLPFRFICHGIPSRCLELWGTPMPLCARCTGVYAGMLIGIFLFTTVGWFRRTLFSTRGALTVIAPLAIDGVTQLVRLRESTNSLRVATGLLAGTAILWALSRVEIDSLARERTQRERMQNAECQMQKSEA